MDRRLLIIAIPLKSFSAGGFLRSYNVLTNALDILGQSGIEVELYVPISDLVEFLLSLKRSPSVDLGDAIKRIEQELSIFTSSMFQQLFPELMKLLKQGYRSWSRIFSGRLNRFISFDLIYLRLRKNLELKYSRTYLEGIRNVSAIYSMNENIEALHALCYFSKKLNTRAALMLQLAPYTERV